MENNDLAQLNRSKNLEELLRAAEQQCKIESIFQQQQKNVYFFGISFIVLLSLSLNKLNSF